MQTSDDSTFVAAIDDVGRPDPQGDGPVEVKGWHVDDQGRFQVMIYQGEACDADSMYVLKMLRCWVLCSEPAPPSPETSEQLAVRSAATFASQKIAAYQQYVTLPDADLWKASQEMVDVARPLEAAGWAE